MKFTAKNIDFGEELDEEMFEIVKGYKQVLSMKKKVINRVPNCVPNPTVKKENTSLVSI